MATNYTGDPTAAQTPSGAPIPDTAPIVVIPADGEAENAASITQLAKVPADWIAWLMKPRARASQWAEPIHLYRDGGLRKRFGIDHLGFPMGKLQVWQENWGTQIFVIGAGSLQLSAFSDQGWQFGSKKAAGSGAVQVQFPDATWPHSRYVEIDAGNSAGDYSFAQRVAPCMFHADVVLAMEWDMKLPATPNYDIAMGFGGQSDFATGAHGAHAWFYNAGGSGNWRCQTDDGTALNDQDSGVAIGTSKTRFRIEYHGVNVDEAGAERVLFFINGTLVKNLTANMPSAASPATAAPLFAMASAGGSSGVMTVGVPRFCCNLWPDAF